MTHLAPGMSERVVRMTWSAPMCLLWCSAAEVPILPDDSRAGFTADANSW